MQAIRPDDANFGLILRPKLKWKMWNRVVNAVSFVQSYLEYKELQCRVNWELSPGQVRVIGVGRMWCSLGTDKVGVSHTASG